MYGPNGTKNEGCPQPQAMKELKNKGLIFILILRQNSLSFQHYNHYNYLAGASTAQPIARLLII